MEIIIGSSSAQGRGPGPGVGSRIEDYNTVRMHSALGVLSPGGFRAGTAGRRGRPTMSPFLPSSRLRLCLALSMSFLLGPYGPARLRLDKACAPALTWGRQSRAEPGSASSGCSHVQGKPGFPGPDGRLILAVVDAGAGMITADHGFPSSGCQRGGWPRPAAGRRDYPGGFSLLAFRALSAGTASGRHGSGQDSPRQATLGAG